MQSESRESQEHEPAQLRGKARQAARHLMIAQLLSQFVAVAALAWLYRLLDPHHFGLFGMVLPLVMLPRMMALLGLSVATVQRNRLESDQLSGLFWLSLLLGLATAGLTILLGHALWQLYGEPLLVDLCYGLAGASLVVAAGLVHQALLERKLLLGRLVAARIAGQVAGVAAAIVAALQGWGVWALVLQQYVELSVISGLAWLLEPWRPGLPSRSRRAAGLLRLGGHYSLSSLMFYLGQNLDKILIALLLGSTRLGQQALGMYSQAYQLMMKPVSALCTPVTGVMLPALSRAWPRQQLHAQIASGYYRLVAAVLFPAAVGLYLVAEDTMAVLGGDAWQPAGWLLAALAPVVLAQGLINITGSLLTSAGRTGILLFGSILNTVILAQAVIAGSVLGRQYLGDAPWGQVRGIACGVSLATVGVILFPYMVAAFKAVGSPLQDLLSHWLKLLLAALVMGLGVYCLGQLAWIENQSPLVRLLCQVACGVGLYGLVARRQIRETWHVVAGRGEEA